jgi:microsomal epoxide hydrolase
MITRRELVQGTAAGTVLAALPLAAAAQPARVEPFRLEAPQATLERIRQRVRDYRWYAPPLGSDGQPLGWRYGTDLAWLRELCGYWLEGYDWRRSEARLNALPMRRARVGELDLHFVHERGSGSRPTPLLIVHGWPYTFQSYAAHVMPLAHPERFGGRAEDAFDVVVVSVPGYGFSGAPAGPTTLRALGRLYQELMTGVLGYHRYIAHGGDQGAISATYMALDFPGSVAGLHKNMLFPRHASAPSFSGALGPGNASDAERAFIKAEAAMAGREMAYIQTHITRPETLSPAMMDSPVGLASWLLEKFYFWSDRRERPFETIFTRDQLLDQVMVYLVSDTFRSSLWTYAAFQLEPVALPDGVKVTVPTGVTQWSGDAILPVNPREFVERSHANIVHWAVMGSGGHYPFLEQPDAWLADLQAFRRQVA